jgi:hypothetical protein
MRESTQANFQKKITAIVSVIFWIVSMLGTLRAILSKEILSTAFMARLVEE